MDIKATQHFSLLNLSKSWYNTFSSIPQRDTDFATSRQMWRKVVLEWRTDNLLKSLLKTDVAPILEKLLPKLNKTTLKNGFEAYAHLIQIK